MFVGVSGTNLNAPTLDTNMLREGQKHSLYENRVTIVTLLCYRSPDEMTRERLGDSLIRTSPHRMTNRQNPNRRG
jgi:hypothetical protein